MADAQIQQELTNIRAIIETMRADQEKLKERDDMMATRLDQVDKAITSRVTVLEAAYAGAGAQDRGKDHGLRHRDAEKYMPDKWSGEKGACSFSDFAYEVANYLSVLEPMGTSKGLLEWAASQKQPISDTDVGDLDLDEKYPHARALDSALGHMLTKVTTHTAKTMVKQAGPGCGLRAWQNLATWYRPRSAMDQATSITMVMNPGQCRDVSELHRRLEEWEVAVTEHESRFDDRVQESVRTAALLSMIPKAMYDQRFKGRAFPTYLDLRQELANYLADRRPTIQVKPTAPDVTPMDIGEVQDGGEIGKLRKEIEELNAVVRAGKGPGKGRPKGQTESQDWSQAWSPPRKGDGKGKGAGRDSKGKGKGKGKRDLVCFNCGGRGHPARLCPTPQGLGEMEEGEAEGTETYPHVCEEEEELQICGLCDPGHTLPQPMCLLAEEDELLGTIGSTAGPQKGWVKITAVVDSGAAENAMPEETVPFVQTSPSPGSKAGKVYRGAAGEPIPNCGQKVITVRTQEGQSRRSTWQICPVTRPLMSVARCTAAGNKVHLEEKDPRITNIKTGESTRLRKEGNVFVIDLWVKQQSATDSQQPHQRPSGWHTVVGKRRQQREKDGDVVMEPGFTRQGR